MSDRRNHILSTVCGGTDPSDVIKGENTTAVYFYPFQVMVLRWAR